MSRAFIPLVRPAGVQAPVPQSKNQNVGDPKRRCREQEFLWRFFRGGQSADQPDDRENQASRKHSVHCKPKDGIQLLPTGMMSDDARDQ